MLFHKIKILLPLVIVCLKLGTFVQGIKTSECSLTFNYLSISKTVRDIY